LGAACRRLTVKRINELWLTSNHSRGTARIVLLRGAEGVREEPAASAVKAADPIAEVNGEASVAVIEVSAVPSVTVAKVRPKSNSIS